MSNTVHEKLQPLQDVLDEREKELEKIQNLTGEELQKKQTEIEQDISQKLKEAIPEVRANISAFIKAQENIPDDEKIKESELVLLLDEIVDEIGGEDYPSRDELMEQLGLKTTTSNSEFFDLDENYNLSKEEVRQETYDESISGTENLNRNIESVVREYIDEISSQKDPITSFEGLKNFLITTKMPLILNALSQKYSKKTKSSSSQQSLVIENSGGGIDALSSFLGSGSGDPELEKFYNAILVGGSINEKVFLNSKGEYNPTSARIAIEKQIASIFSDEKIGLNTLDSYKNAVLDNTLATPEGLTKAGHEKAAKLLEEVPEKFHNTKFAKEYEAYIENSAKKGKIPEKFDEWLGERPKQGGIGGIIENLSLMLTKSGLGKILRDFFGADSWFGKLFGAEESDEEKEDDEDFKSSQYKSRRAYEHGKLAEEMVTKDDILTLDWKDVLISGISMSTEGVPDLSSVTPDQLVELKKVLESDNCKFAKIKNLTLDELVWIKDNVTIKDENGFTITRGDETNTFDYTTAGIAAAKECTKEVGVEEQIGDTYKDYFDEALPPEAFTSSEQSYETLQPALKSLLKLDKEEFWKVYSVTPEDMTHFLSVIGGNGGWMYTKKFRNTEDTFYVEGSKFKQSEGMFGGSNDEFDSVEAFFKTL